MKNYYAILGIERSASADDIKAAYRAQARKWHPDVAGQEHLRLFQNIQEAYEVLGDDKRRHDYDNLGRVPSRRSPITIDERVLDISGDLYDYLSQGFSRLREIAWAPPAQSTSRELPLEVHLAPEEAAAGVRLTLAIPAAEACPRCGGRGLLLGRFACDTCDGNGAVYALHQASFGIPAGISDDTVLIIPLDGAGLPDVYLKIHVHVR